MQKQTVLSVLFALAAVNVALAHPSAVQASAALEIQQVVQQPFGDYSSPDYDHDCDCDKCQKHKKHKKDKGCKQRGNHYGKHKNRHDRHSCECDHHSCESRKRRDCGDDDDRYGNHRNGDDDGWNRRDRDDDAPYGWNRRDRDDNGREETQTKWPNPQVKVKPRPTPTSKPTSTRPAGAKRNGAPRPVGTRQ